MARPRRRPGDGGGDPRRGRPARSRRGRPRGRLRRSIRHGGAAAARGGRPNGPRHRLRRGQVRARAGRHGGAAAGRRTGRLRAQLQSHRPRPGDGRARGAVGPPGERGRSGRRRDHPDGQSRCGARLPRRPRRGRRLPGAGAQPGPGRCERLLRCRGPAARRARTHRSRRGGRRPRGAGPRTGAQPRPAVRRGRPGAPARAHRLDARIGLEQSVAELMGASAVAS